VKGETGLYLGSDLEELLDNRIWPMMSPLANHLAWPLRIMSWPRTPQWSRPAFSGDLGHPTADPPDHLSERSRDAGHLRMQQGGSQYRRLIGALPGAEIRHQWPGRPDRVRLGSTCASGGVKTGGSAASSKLGALTQLPKFEKIAPGRSEVVTIGSGQGFQLNLLTGR